MHPNAKPDELYTARMAAEIIGVHMETIKRWRAKGLLAAVCLTPGGLAQRDFRYRAEDVFRMKEQWRDFSNPTTRRWKVRQKSE